MSKEINKWVFKSHGQMTVIIRGTVTSGVFNAQGMIIPGSQMKMKPIKLNFDNCHCIVDEDSAKKAGMPLEDLIELIKAYPTYGTSFWPIVEPTKPMTKEVEKELKEEPKSTTKVIKGIRK